MNFLSIQWLWLYAGAGLLLSEIFVSGCVVMFFGAGALVTGLTLFAWPEMPFWAQMVEFSAFSIVSLVACRRFFMGALGIDAPKNEIREIEDAQVGKIAKVVSAISPALPGRVLLGDAEWDATSSASIPPGAIVRVTARRNLTLQVEQI